MAQVVERLHSYQVQGPESKPQYKKTTYHAKNTENTK
jgi:hypothetical protein